MLEFRALDALCLDSKAFPIKSERPFEIVYADGDDSDA